MVGAAVLFVIALVTGIFGLSMWVFLDGMDQQIKGLVLCVISAVALSGALIIDGIRYYADKVTRQLDWMVKRGSALGGGSIDRENGVGGNVGVRPLARFHIIGKDRDTGLDTELVVQASDQTAAMRTGEKAGVEVRRVEKID